jgi:hypothetical protein
MNEPGLPLPQAKPDFSGFNTRPAYGGRRQSILLCEGKANPEPYSRIRNSISGIFHLC